MALRTEIIPGTILRAARRVGLKAPDWYVGRTNGHDQQVDHITIAEIIEQAERSDAAAQRSGRPGESG